MAWISTTKPATPTYGEIDRPINSITPLIDDVPYLINSITDIIDEYRQDIYGRLMKPAAPSYTSITKPTL